jgi:hypothetical protein
MSKTGSPHSTGVKRETKDEKETRMNKTKSKIEEDRKSVLQAMMKKTQELEETQRKSEDAVDTLEEIWDPDGFRWKKIDDAKYLIEECIGDCKEKIGKINWFIEHIDDIKPKEINKIMESSFRYIYSYGDKQ